MATRHPTRISPALKVCAVRGSAPRAPARAAVAADCTVLTLARLARYRDQPKHESSDQGKQATKEASDNP